MNAQKYFRIFSYPLLPVEQEVWQLGHSHTEVTDQKLWKIREERQTIAYRKWRKALRWGRVLATLPFVEMIAVCNNLAYDNAMDESDIDLFIVTTSKRIWTARFFVAGILKFLGLRPTLRTTRDRLCASFFVSTDHLNISDLQLFATSPSPSPHRRGVGSEVRDPYLLYWVATLYPIYDRGGVYNCFWNANAWIKECLPNVTQMIPHPWRTTRLGRLRALSRSLLEAVFGNRFEQWARRVQIQSFPPTIRDRMNKDTSVVVRDDVLKFHTNDRREEYRKQFYAENY